MLLVCEVKEDPFIIARELKGVHASLLKIEQENGKVATVFARHTNTSHWRIGVELSLATRVHSKQFKEHKKVQPQVYGKKCEVSSRCNGVWEKETSDVFSRPKCGHG